MLENNNDGKKYYAVEETLLNKMISMISAMPYLQVSQLMKEIEVPGTFKLVVVQEENKNDKISS